MLVIHWERGGGEGEKGQIAREQKNRAREKTAEAVPLQILPQWTKKKIINSLSKKEMENFI